MDNRDFDMRKIPGIEARLASGVPESMDLSYLADPPAPPLFTPAELRLLQGCVLRQLAGDRQLIAVGLPGTSADAARRDALRALADKLAAVLEESKETPGSGEEQG